MTIMDVPRPTAAPPPVITCAYPLASTLAQVTALGFNSLLPVSDNDQTATLTVQGGLAVTNNGGVFTNLAAPQTLDFSAGQAAIEFGFDIPTGLDTVDSDIGIVGTLATDFSHQITVLSSNRNRSGVNTYGLLISINGSIKYSNFLLTEPVTLVGLLLDADAGTLSAYVNNDSTPLTIPSNTYTPGHYLAGVQASEPAAIDVGDAGKQYVCHVRTGAPYFQTTVLPGGTVDGCGNLIENRALRWDGAQHLNGGTLAVSNGGLTLNIASSGPSAFTAIKSAEFPVAGLYKYVIRAAYPSQPDTLFLGAGTAALDVDTFANQSNNVQSVYCSGSTALHAFCNADEAIGTVVASGTFDMSIYGDTRTGDWAYADELGNVATGLGAAVGSAVPPLGLFAYFKGVAGATLTLLKTDGNVPDLPVGYPNVAK